MIFLSSLSSSVLPLSPGNEHWASYIPDIKTEWWQEEPPSPSPPHRIVVCLWKQIISIKQKTTAWSKTHVGQNAQDSPPEEIGTHTQIHSRLEREKHRAHFYNELEVCDFCKDGLWEFVCFCIPFGTEECVTTALEIKEKNASLSLGWLLLYVW